MKTVKVTRKQIRAAQAAVRLSKVTGRPVKPVVARIANAQRTVKISLNA